MSNFNARVPLVGLHNRRKNENSSSNARSANKIHDLNGDPFKINNAPSINSKNHANITMFNHDKKEGIQNFTNNNGKAITQNNAENMPQKQLVIQTQEEKLANEEHYKCTIKALKEAIDENEDLREKMKLIIQENEKLKSENEEKTNALIELAEFYEFCKTNHTEKNNCTCKSKRRNSDSENNLNRKRKKSNSL